MRKSNSKKLMLQAAILAVCVGPATALMAQVSNPSAEDANQACSMQIMAGQNAQNQLEMPYLQEVLQFRERNTRILQSYLSAFDANSDRRIVQAAGGLLTYNRRLTRMANDLINQNANQRAALPAAQAAEIAPLVAARQAGLRTHEEAVTAATTRFDGTRLYVNADGVPRTSFEVPGDAPEAARNAGAYYDISSVPARTCTSDGPAPLLSNNMSLVDARNRLNARAAELTQAINTLTEQIQAIRGRTRRTRSARATLEANLAGARSELNSINSCFLPNLDAVAPVVAEARTRLEAEVAEHRAAQLAIDGPGTELALMSARHHAESDALRARGAELQAALNGLEARGSEARLYGLRDIANILNPLLTNPANTVSSDLMAAIAGQYENSCTFSRPGDSFRTLVISDPVGRARGRSIAPLSLGFGPLACTQVGTSHVDTRYPGRSPVVNETSVRVCNGAETSWAATRTRHSQYARYQVCSSVDLANPDRPVTHETEFLDGSGQVIDVVLHSITPDCFAFYLSWRDGRESLRPLPEGTAGGIDFGALERSMRRIEALLTGTPVAQPAAPVESVPAEVIPAPAAEGAGEEASVAAETVPAIAE